MGLIDRAMVDAADVASPCVQTCTLNIDDICIGCGRTIDEIAAWGSMSVAARRAVLATLPQRIATLD